jgi:hypothetical protein
VADDAVPKTVGATIVGRTSHRTSRQLRCFTLVLGFRRPSISRAGNSPTARGGRRGGRSNRRLRWVNSDPRMWLQMINVQEFARRLSTLGADKFTSDDVVDLATAADVRISADLEIDATQAQRFAASQWPPPTSSRPAAPSVSFSSPGAVDGPTDQPTRRRGSGPARGGRRPGSRRTGR